MKTVLTVAGSDPSGGAGIQADLKTIAAHRLYGMSVITALTAQNTLGVSEVWNVPKEFFGKQLEAVLCDIPPDASKIGMIPNEGLVEETARLFRNYRVKNVVVDPVMLSTSGRQLIEEDAVKRMEQEIFPQAVLITPNIPEAEILCGTNLMDERDQIAAAQFLFQKYRTSVLIKGGHSTGNAVDLLFCDGTLYRFSAPRIDNPNTHGTGCTLSSAIACGLAVGFGLPESIASAKRYLTDALRRKLDLGHGIGPLDHEFV